MRKCRDISSERRRQATACVDRHLQDLRRLFARGGLPCRLVEGSAAAAEAHLADTNTRHTAVRVALLVDPDERDAVERTLCSNGFRAAAPTGDVTLLRLAAQRGRRAVHVLVEGDAFDGQASPERLHPAHPAAAAARHARIRRAFEPVTGTFRRVRETAAPEQDIVESFEVHLVQRPGR